MKCKSSFFRLIPVFLFISVLVSCGSGRLDGIYTGTVGNDTVAVVFFGEKVFLDAFYNYNSRVDAGNIDTDSSVLYIENDIFPYTLRGNTLTLDYNGETVVFTKDTRNKASAAINGIWSDNNEWSFAFTGDKIYIIDEDGDASSGTFIFDKNEGTINSHWYDVDFTVSGNTLTAELWGNNLVLTRKP